jgi:dTDP-4-amino-4,6-dideoxygalactose transaminase
MENSHQAVIEFIRDLYKTEKFIPLHEPKFFGNEKKYLSECIDSTFVSSVGKFVDQFESMICEFTGAQYAVAAVNGTAALHIALKLVGVDSGDEVITQPLSFIATCNAINYCNANPVFVDVDLDSMGMSPESLRTFLKLNTRQESDICINTITGKKIAAVVPMHTFGLPCRVEEIEQICQEFNIPLVEDAAESLGSYFNGKHTGTFGKVGTLSFNGNKTITTGGGGRAFPLGDTLLLYGVLLHRIHGTDEIHRRIRVARNLVEASINELRLDNISLRCRGFGAAVAAVGPRRLRIRGLSGMLSGSGSGGWSVVGLSHFVAGIEAG